MKIQRLIIFTVLVGIATALSNQAAITAQTENDDSKWVDEVNAELERRDAELQPLIERNKRLNATNAVQPQEENSNYPLDFRGSSPR